MSFHTARLVIKDYYGFPSNGSGKPLPGVSINVLAADRWKEARKRNAISGLKKLRGIDYNSSGAELQRRGRSQKDVSALCLDYRNLYPADINAFPSGATPGLTVAHNPFKRGSGIQFTDGTPGVVCEVPGPEIAENGAHSIQFYIHKPPEEELQAQGKLAVWAYRWGMNVDGVKGFWQFQVINGQASIMRLLPQKIDASTGKPDPNTGWTQARETQLHTLLTIDDPTNAETDQIAGLQKELYDCVERLNLGKGNIYNQSIEVTFIAEGRGVATVDEAERDADAIEVPDVIKKRVSGVLWPAATSRIYSTMGIFWLQFGKPQFKKTGDIRLGMYIHPIDINYGAAKLKMIKDTPAGTAIELVHESGDPDDPNYNPKLGGDAVKGWERETVLRLSGDGTSTPFLYAAHVYLEAGARSGTETTTWDSADHPYCIIEIDPQLEGSSTGPISRKSLYRITLRAFANNEGDGVFQYGDNLRHAHKRFENHVADLYINGTKRVGNGLITDPNFTNAKSAEEYPTADNMQAQNALWEWTNLELDLNDKWFVLDEDMFVGDEPVGDGSHMGEHLRSTLRSAGERYPEIGFNDDAGPIIETASLGEKFLAQPDPYERKGSYMVEFIRKHDTARNQIGVDNNGVWQFGPYNTAPKMGKDGSPVNFQSGIRNHPDTYPGRYAILKKFEMTRDFSKVYNYFIGIGAEDENGNPIIRSRADWASIKGSGNVPRTNALGRRRIAQPVRDSSWRTPLQVERAIRRQVLEECRSGWFLVFETYWHDDFYAGDNFFAEGWPAELIRVPQGTWANDRMTFAVLIFD